MVVVGAIGCRRGVLLSWMGGFFQANQFPYGWIVRVKLWRHRWCGDETLAIAFLAICRLAADRDAWVFWDWCEKVPSGLGTRAAFWAAHSAI